MELSYNELKKRDVINISDGRCLGRIIDMRLKFPKGVLVGIVVPGRKKGCFSFFDKSELYIDESKIVKIGGDVILVDIRCADACAPCVPIHKGEDDKGKRPCPPPDCDKFNPKNFCSGDGRIDLEDY